MKRTKYTNQLRICLSPPFLSPYHIHIFMYAWGYSNPFFLSNPNQVSFKLFPSPLYEFNATPFTNLGDPIPKRNLLGKAKSSHFSFCNVFKGLFFIMNLPVQIYQLSCLNLPFCSSFSDFPL